MLMQAAVPRTLLDKFAIFAVMRKIFSLIVLPVVLLVSCQKDKSSEPAKPAPVDLGLSVYWADINAQGFYSWGETLTKTSYDWAGYKWADGTRDSITKYCDNPIYGTVDGKTLLEAGDDPATALLGSGWRLPTAAEWQELIDNCDWSKDTKDGHPGLRVKAKEGESSIFIPFSGGYEGSTLFGEDSRGLYWSRELSTESAACATVFNCYSSSSSIVRGVTYASRSYGLPIRAVKIK